ncbi:P antigen family member 3-like [Choloepus didactylus]|uniref:P antigen family member 3-like n=1 Tax=Choloepus didactylus TaxID=27675 RepID=UPI00189DF62A|nr:P antigen family member 3-like [Choloepus didactylus]XP_037678269.1 P antigen family member 3-like [Choloepus didactylus]XP_037678271.1 P antigen family member 3-like [Choloepus didactylus]XP_037678272.1 P antigen family member 3-like [Choloepus didactylus]
MSGKFISTPKSEERINDQDPSQPAGPGVAEQSSDEQPEHNEPPTESQDVPPGQEIEHEGAHACQGSDLEHELQELTQPKTGGKRGDGPDIKGEIVTNLEPVKMPESGEGQPQI